MALPASVPAWVAENQRRFLSTPPDARSPQHPKLPFAITFNSANVDETEPFGDQTTASRGIFPPTIPPPSNYFRDPTNHPDVLVTILNTAMLTVGFDPTSNNANEQHRAFLAFIQEVQRYGAYVTMDSYYSRNVAHSHSDCSIFVGDVVNIITGGLTGETDGGFVQRLTNSITGIAQSLFSQSNQTEWVKDIAFDNVSVPSSASAPHLNPKSATSFAIVKMLRSETSHKFRTTTLVQGEYYVSSVVFRLMSSAVIAYADYLEGSHITGSDDYVNFLNSGRK